MPLYPDDGQSYTTNECGRKYVTTSNINFSGGKDTGPRNDLPPKTLYYPYGAYNPSRCDCSQVNNPYGNTYVGVGDCAGGDSAWDCCGCVIKSWNQANLPGCCKPDSTQDAGVYGQACDPSWCPFGRTCLLDKSTNNVTNYKDHCVNNIDDKRCLDACKQFNTATTYQDRPTWCDEYVTKYCKRHEYAGNPDIDSLCSCTNTPILNPECISIKCTNNHDAWRSTDQWSKNCGTICANIIEQAKNMGPEDVDHNSLQNNCSTTISTSSPSSTPQSPSTTQQQSDTSSQNTSSQNTSSTDPNSFRNLVRQHPITAYTNLFDVEGWWKTPDGWIGIGIIIGLLVGIVILIFVLKWIFSSSKPPSSQVTTPVRDVTI